MSPIASMTAFARKSHETSIGTLTCELRSVNHRYLDLSLYLAEPLRVHEKEIREYLQHHLSRGKVDLGIKFQPSLHQAIQFELNTELTNKLAEVSHELSGTFKNVQINLMDLLSWPGVLKTAEIDISDLKNSVMALLKVSVEELIATRQREGASIYAFLDQCLAR